MKRILMLALLVLGTGAFANGKPVAAKSNTKTETVIKKHKKSLKKAKRLEATKTETPTSKK
jgi:hypothetical protein